jgi:hypothetical protein
MATSPTQLSLKMMREQGYYAEVVERYNSFTRKRNDLCGFIDILCLMPGEVVGVQTTSYSNLSARIKKIREHENFVKVQDSGIIIIVHGWAKRNNRWHVKGVQIGRGLEGDTIVSELPSVKHGSGKAASTRKKPCVLREDDSSGNDEAPEQNT